MLSRISLPGVRFLRSTSCAKAPRPIAPRLIHSMASTTNGSEPAKPKNNGGKKEVKILMLHGYTQSGSLFRAKTRALEKLLAKALSPISLLPVLIYPTGPNRLRPQDIPGYLAPDGTDDGAAADEEKFDSWAWFRKDEATGNYRFLAEGMKTAAAAIRDAGGIDGVCGFSQGGAMTGLVAAALEPNRHVPEGSEYDWVRALRDANDGRGLSFAASYSGFLGIDPAVAWCYEPKISTPTLHFLGSLDTVVEEGRSKALVDRCESPLVVTHPGGHYVPVSKEWVMPLAGFIKQHIYDAPKAGL